MAAARVRRTAAPSANFGVQHFFCFETSTSKPFGVLTLLLYALLYLYDRAPNPWYVDRIVVHETREPRPEAERLRMHRQRIALHAAARAKLEVT